MIALTFRGTLGLGLGLALLSIAPSTAHAVGVLEDLYRLDRLPTFRDGVRVGSFSSYDRTGNNDDGFSGTHSFLRKEGERLVIAEMKGPGAIYRIWTPTPTDDLVEFFFDGEEKPRLSVKFRDLFSGKQFPFLRPVVGLGAGGFYSYLPLAYRDSCKVTIKAAKLQFYQINYATFADGRDVKTFDPNAGDALRGELNKAAKLIGAAGADISDQAVAQDARIESHPFDDTLKAGKSVTLFKSDKPGRVAAIKLGPASALAGARRDVLLNVYYDGDDKPAFSCPAGDFFGFSFGDPAARSLVIGTDEDTCYSYWPMPYEKSIRIELASDNEKGAAIAIRGEVKTADQPKSVNEGRFYAVWNREKPTIEGKPYTFINAQGKGHLVGVALQAQGQEPGGMPLFFEGDDETTIDGELVIRGTGSEDFFNGGWYDVPGQWEDRVTLPLSGCLDYKRYLARTGGYRILLSDAYPFEKSIHSTIEHGPENNKFVTDYTSVAYVYADRAPSTQSLPSANDRRIDEPRRIVFTPGTAMPVYSFSRDAATIGNYAEKIGDHEERLLSLISTVNDPSRSNQFITLLCDVPQTGTYRVSIEPAVGTDSPIVQMIQNEYPLGEAHDLYAAARGKGKPLVMGEVKMAAGKGKITFKLVGRNKAATGVRFDLIRVICERVD